VLGRVLLCVGTVLLLFVAYQLWGTGIAESHSQAVLLKKFDHELERPTPAPVRRGGPTSGHVDDDADDRRESTGADAADPGDSPNGRLADPEIGLTGHRRGHHTADLRRVRAYLGTPLVRGRKGQRRIRRPPDTYGAPFTS